MAASFEALLPHLHARAVGVLVAVAGRSDPMVLGSWRSGAAWSTMKVPLSLAALRHDGAPGTRELAERALTASDNAAAAALWASLGAGSLAADAVDRRLAADGDGLTRTQWRQVRPPFSAFGQTQWSLDGQGRFLAGLACDQSPEARLVKQDMAAVTPSQRWGLGRLAGALYKGGWGPDSNGRYLVRQIGIVRRGSQLVAAALAVTPDDGSFAQGTATLDTVAGWLRAALRRLPPAARTC